VSPGRASVCDSRADQTLRLRARAADKGQRRIRHLGRDQNPKASIHPDAVLGRGRLRRGTARLSDIKDRPVPPRHLRPLRAPNPDWFAPRSRRLREKLLATFLIGHRTPAFAGGIGPSHRGKPSIRAELYPRCFEPVDTARRPGPSPAKEHSHNPIGTIGRFAMMLEPFSARPRPAAARSRSRKGAESREEIGGAGGPRTPTLGWQSGRHAGTVGKGDRPDAI